MQKFDVEPRDFVAKISSGDKQFLSKGITMVESTLPEHQSFATEIIDACLAEKRSAVRIGITGVPGVGKSTFINVFGKYLIEKLGKKVAVLAIDPSSTVSGGSILGDKTRMTELSQLDNAFIRPSPTSGSLGGVAAKTRETITLCEAAGYDVILIETVGVGQSETDVRNMVDFFMLLMLAGAGDELQGIKRGIMELADGVLINKADGDNLTKAKKAASEYKSALHFLSNAENNWSTKVDHCSALENQGLDKAWNMVQAYFDQLGNNGIDQLRQHQDVIWFHNSIRHLMEQQLAQSPAYETTIREMEKAITAGKKSPTRAAAEFLKNLQA